MEKEKPKEEEEQVEKDKKVIIFRKRFYSVVMYD